MSGCGIPIIPACSIISSLGLILATRGSWHLLLPSIVLSNESIHNTSTLLSKQLVLVLELGVGGLEVIEQLPSGISETLAEPVYQNLPHTMVQACANNVSGLWYSVVVDDRGQLNNVRRCSALVLLQEYHMENIVDARLVWKLEAISNRANALDHLEGAVVAECKLGILAALDGRRSALV